MRLGMMALAGAGLAAVALAMFTASQSAAFVRAYVERGDACLYWDTRAIPWAMNEDGDPRLGYTRAHAVFERAYETWSSVPCTDVVFVDESPSSETRVGYERGTPGDNLVVFRADDCQDVVPDEAACRSEGGCANEFGCWTHGDMVIAVTTSTYNTRTGETLDADIEMNAAWFEFTDTNGPTCVGGAKGDCVHTDMESTAAHEIGHVLGLGHTEFRDAVMFASSRKGDTSKRRLTRDDIEGVCHIYPKGGPTNRCGEEGSQGAGCDCQSGSGPGGLLGLLAVSLALFLRRRE